MTRRFLCVLGTSLEKDCIAAAKTDFDRVKRPDDPVYFVIDRLETHNLARKYEMSMVPEPSRRLMDMHVISMYNVPGNIRFVITQDPGAVLEELCDQ